METAALNLAALDVDPVQIPVITREIRKAGSRLVLGCIVASAAWIGRLPSEAEYDAALIVALTAVNLGAFPCEQGKAMFEVEN
jgi:hypothetical protein